MRSTGVAIIVMLAAALAVNTTSIAQLQSELTSSDDTLAGITFHSLILIPTKDNKISNVHSKQTNIEEQTNMMDLVGAFVDHYDSLDGQRSNLDVILQNPEGRKIMKSRLLDFTMKTMTDRPWRFARQGKDTLVFSFNTIESCIKNADFGLTFTFDGEKKVYEVTIGEKKLEVDSDEFGEAVMPFLKEACSLIQLAKIQVRPHEQSAAMVELKSVKTLLQSKLSEFVPTILKNMLAKVAEVDSVRHDCRRHFRKEGYFHPFGNLRGEPNRKDANSKSFG